ncbi:hypothetical protein [Tolypothrix sp. LEGE 11397]|nr:hypothetical protein [Tolypothrix sp. LEGE 11397]
MPSEILRTAKSARMLSNASSAFRALSSCSRVWSAWAIAAVPQKN